MRNDEGSTMHRAESGGASVPTADDGSPVTGSALHASDMSDSELSALCRVLDIRVPEDVGVRLLPAVNRMRADLTELWRYQVPDRPALRFVVHPER